jgi:alcohol dehydrogenase YqhD (iron-dependent ADH family)
MSELMWCGSISHNGLTGLGAAADFSVHQLGHELSGKFNIAHGASLSIMWGPWARYTCSVNQALFARYAEKVWGADADVHAGIERTVAYFKMLGMPTCFSESEIGVQPEDVVNDLAYRCSFYEKRKVGQFMPLDRNDLYEIYKLANR